MKITIATLFALFSAANAYAPNPAITVAAKGMSLLKPIFKAEAEIQAAALGAISKVNKETVIQEIKDNKTKNKALIYTYGLSPFSTEAIKILEGTGYEFTKIELGAEWFLLGGEASVTRVALSEEAEDGATSLPKIFIGGECIGGCSALSDLAESGELETLLSKSKVPKIGGEKKGAFSFFN
jgi:glutaredoxin-related protein